MKLNRRLLSKRSVVVPFCLLLGLSGCAIGFGIDSVKDTAELEEEAQIFVARCNGSLRSQKDCAKLADEYCEAGYKTVPNPIEISKEAKQVSDRELYFSCNPVPEEAEDSQPVIN